MKANNVTTMECNEFYDVERCHNGGGYSQPKTVIDFDDGTTMTIYDTSCGEFGSRVNVEYEDCGEILAECGYGSMVDYPFSTFEREKHGELLEHVYNLTGYRLITVEDIVEGGL